MVTSNLWLRTSSPFAVNGARRLEQPFGFSNAIGETWTMPAEIVETADELRLTLEVPGLRPEDIELTIENGVLTVSGEKKVQTQDGATANYRLAERRYGRYGRRFRLPSTVDASGVHASCEHGVLTIRLPRAEQARPRRIPVNGNGSTEDVTPRSE